MQFTKEQEKQLWALSPHEEHWAQVHRHTHRHTHIHTLSLSTVKCSGLGLLGHSTEFVCPAWVIITTIMDCSNCSRTDGTAEQTLSISQHPDCPGLLSSVQLVLAMMNWLLLYWTECYQELLNWVLLCVCQSGATERSASVCLSIRSYWTECFCVSVHRELLNWVLLCVCPLGATELSASVSLSGATELGASVSLSIRSYWTESFCVSVCQELLNWELLRLCQELLNWELLNWELLRLCLSGATELRASVPLSGACGLSGGVTLKASNNWRHSCRLPCLVVLGMFGALTKL